jgi:D-glycero-D-manno-heptose 1,7-bisphosphate phosphatase
VNPAIFLDRDGVIIENRDQYVRGWDDVRFYPEALAALARISQSLYKIIIVTNQSVVGRGLISAFQAGEINQAIKKAIEGHGGRIDAIYMCPHAPNDGCACRKPQPGLLLKSASELCVDLSQSIMIGDALDDLRAGQAAGVSRTILLLTGRGRSQLRQSSAQDLKPFEVFDGLGEALDSILTRPP